MKLHRRLLTIINQLGQKITPHSLRGRLTVGIAVVSAIGLGSVSLGISWKIQQILIASHKQNIKFIAERLPHDIVIYQEMAATKNEAIQKAIDNLTTDNIVLWLQRENGEITAQSSTLLTKKETLLVSSSIATVIPDIYELDGRHWVFCGSSLKVNGVHLGKAYIAQDITADQAMFLGLIRSLTLATVLAIGGITIVIALYIKRSLNPLHKLSQLTATISADHLGEAKIQLENAPSEVKELAQTFDDMLVRLFDAWEHQRQFMSNASHELRTPLTIVSGYLQSTLRRGSNLTEPQREALEIASSESDRTIKLLQDLLDLARADSGHLHCHIQSVILNDFVAEVVGMTEQYSNRIIQFTPPAHYIIVKTDPNRLKQVLLNLIDNAVKYSEDPNPITIQLQQDPTQGIIQVCDRGNGIPLKQQSLIFERFYRLDDSRSRSQGGTGLGLSIVKTLVEQMGGSVSVRSRLGEGSTFLVSLPCCMAVQG